MKKSFYLFLILMIGITYSCKKKEAEDTTPPIIKLKGSTSYKIFLDSNFTDSGYVATDDIDGDISSLVVVNGTVNTHIEGKYIIKYNVKDAAGNQAEEKIRTIIVSRYLQVLNIQNGFGITYTAVWCEPCGNWGAPLIHNYALDAPKGAIISLHLSDSDSMKTHLSYSFAYDRSYNMAIPAFWVGDQKASSSTAMTDYLAQNPYPPCGIDYSYNIDDNKMFIDTKTLFFKKENGDFYLSVLILEDGIDGSSYAPTNYIQAGTTNSYPNDIYTHDFVIRTSSVADSAYGELLIHNPSIDTAITTNHEINLDPNWINPYPICIIWKYEPGTKPEYHYINSLKRKKDTLKSW